MTVLDSPSQPGSDISGDRPDLRRLPRQRAARPVVEQPAAVAAVAGDAGHRVGRGRQLEHRLRRASTSSSGTWRRRPTASPCSIRRSASTCCGRRASSPSASSRRSGSTCGCSRIPKGGAGELPRLQRVDLRHAAAQVRALLLRRPHPDVGAGAGAGRGRAHRRDGAAGDHAAVAHRGRLEPPGVGPAVGRDRRDRVARRDAPGHRVRHDLVPRSRRDRRQPRVHRDDRASRRHAARDVGSPGASSRSARGVRRVQHRLAGVGRGAHGLLRPRVPRVRRDPPGTATEAHRVPGPSAPAQSGT